jgi:malate dehydrogenase (oxaloacetate-decarboxylating)(NADP+)
MGIPVGKLSLYTACAGVHPEQCLPVTLDVGTNNEEFLNDPYYIGLRQKRVTGADYDAFVDEFMTAARAAFPGVLIQFEDFANHSAFRLLHKYRDEACVFNDDIQGTAAVALAGLFSALRITRGKLRDQTILFLGAGEAATGIADLIVSAMMADGMSEADAVRRNWLVDSRGLVVRDRQGLHGHKLRYAHEQAPISNFLTAIETLKPTAIIGVAAVGGAFTPEVLQAMAKLNEQPIVFPPPRRNARPQKPTGTPADERCLPVAARSTRSSWMARPTCRARATIPTSSPASASVRSQAAASSSLTRCSWRPRIRWRIP